MVLLCSLFEPEVNRGRWAPSDSRPLPLAPLLRFSAAMIEERSPHTEREAHGKTTPLQYFLSAYPPDEGATRGWYPPSCSGIFVSGLFSAFIASLPVESGVSLSFDALRFPDNRQECLVFLPED